MTMHKLSTPPSPSPGRFVGSEVDYQPAHRLVQDKVVFDPPLFSAVQVLPKSPFPSENNATTLASDAFRAPSGKNASSPLDFGVTSAGFVTPNGRSVEEDSRRHIYIFTC